jgi:hypothetical protein
MFDLAGDGLLFVPNAVLFGGLTGIDGSDHQWISSARIVLVMV